MERTFVDYFAANNLFDGAQTDMNAILNSFVVIRNDVFFIALLLRARCPRAGAVSCSDSAGGSSGFASAESGR